MKRKAKKRQLKIDPGYLAMILSCGYDFFKELPGGIEANLDALRDAWRDPDMKAAAIARCEGKPREMPWAEKVFDKGMDPKTATFTEWVEQ